MGCGSSVDAGGPRQSTTVSRAADNRNSTATISTVTGPRLSAQRDSDIRSPGFLRAEKERQNPSAPPTLPPIQHPPHIIQQQQQQSQRQQSYQPQNQYPPAPAAQPVVSNPQIITTTENQSQSQRSQVASTAINEGERRHTAPSVTNAAARLEAKPKATPFQRPDLYLLERHASPEEQQKRREREEELHRSISECSWSMRDSEEAYRFERALDEERRATYGYAGEHTRHGLLPAIGGSQRSNNYRLA